MKNKVKNIFIFARVEIVRFILAFWPGYGSLR